MKANQHFSPTGLKPKLNLLVSTEWEDYALLDSGNGRKLEKYGPHIFDRSEPQAVWKPNLEKTRWEAADAVFNPTKEESGGYWKYKKTLQEGWVMHYRNLILRARTTSGRHMGVFPEQASQWDWIGELIQNQKRPVKVLNLFGYTGLASLAAAQAGASVTHVDASKKSVRWARENQALSKLENCHIRWIVDDAVRFTQREGRRDAKYEGIILDPPKFGRGPKGEKWEFFRLFSILLHACREVLSPKPLFIVITAYAIQASAMFLYYGLDDIRAQFGGTIEAGELALEEKSAGRLVSTAVYARWSAD